MTNATDSTSMLITTVQTRRRGLVTVRTAVAELVTIADDGTVWSWPEGSDASTCHRLAWQEVAAS